MAYARSDFPTKMTTHPEASSQALHQHPCFCYLLIMTWLGSREPLQCSLLSPLIWTIQANTTADAFGSARCTRRSSCLIALEQHSWCSASGASPAALRLCVLLEPPQRCLLQTRHGSLMELAVINLHPHCWADCCDRDHATLTHETDPQGHGLYLNDVSSVWLPTDSCTMSRKTCVRHRWQVWTDLQAMAPSHLPFFFLSLPAWSAVQCLSWAQIVLLPSQVPAASASA